MPLPRAQQLLLLLLALGIPLSVWGALFPQNSWLQVGPVALFLPFAWLGLRRWPMPTTAVACLALFLAAHLLAARWSYSFVPYSEWFGWAEGGRNHFDRLVHFLFGLLWTFPLAEAVRRYAGYAPRQALLFAFLAVQAGSALYEVFEWSLALVMAPESVEAYNGQQGDGFDAQKDMALALGGNLLALTMLIGGGRMTR